MASTVSHRLVSECLLRQRLDTSCLLAAEVPGSKVLFVQDLLPSAFWDGTRKFPPSQKEVSGTPRGAACGSLELLA